MQHPSAPRPATSRRAIAWMDGRVVPASDATVPLLDEGFLRGDAVFDAVLVRGGRTHALEAHLSRLRRSAETLGIRVPVLRQLITDLLAAWGEDDGDALLRLIVTRAGTVRGVVQAVHLPESVSLQPVEMPWRNPLSGAKTLSYAANVWASRQAQAAHADDAVIVSDGNVLEAPTAAVAWVKDGAIHAPDPAQLPILPSITLEQLRQVAEVGLGVHRLEELLDAEEAFLLSASRLLLPIHAVGEAEFPAPGPVTQATREVFVRHVGSNLDPRP